MAKSIKLGADTYLDASGVMMRANSSASRKTLSDLMSGLADTLYLSVAAGTPATLTLGNGTRIVFFSLGADQRNIGIYELYATQAGAASFIPIVQASSVTVTASGSTVTIATSTGSLQVFLLVAAGTVSTS